MTDTITASFDTLLTQSAMTAATQLVRAKREIDEVFGEGYAAANPALVAAFMSAATSDLNTAVTAKVLGGALDRIAEGLEDVALAMTRD